MSEDNQQSIAGLTGTPKTMFILGASMGVGAMALLGLIAVIMLMMNGANIGLAKGDKAPVVEDPNAVVNQPQAEDPTQQEYGPVPEVADGDHVTGKSDAKVTLIEYSDFECPYCSRHKESIDQALKDFPNDVRLVYRHFPLTSIHDMAQKAAVASECASNQGKFWEMHNKLFALSAGTGLTVDAMKAAAKEIGLNTATFDTCLDNDETLDAVTADYQGGIGAGVGGTPATFVNGEIVEGAIPYTDLKRAIQAAGGQS